MVALVCMHGGDSMMDSFFIINRNFSLKPMKICEKNREKIFLDQFFAVNDLNNKISRSSNAT